MLDILAEKNEDLENLRIHNNKVINSVGPRYTREVNIQTDYLNYFEPLLRTQKFRDEMLSLIGKFDRATNELLSQLVSAKFTFDQVEVTKIQKLHSFLNPLLFEIKNDKTFPIQKLLLLMEKFISSVSSFRRIAGELKDSEDRNHLIHLFSKHYDSFSSLRNQISNPETELLNKNILWLRGNAGEGKTHLLCDITVHRMKEGKPSIILVGTDFNKSTNVWKTLCLHFNLDTRSPKKNFLAFIESLSRRYQERVLLVIDAVNEGDGIEIWKKQLKSFIGSIKNSKFLSICLSCRSTYEFFFDFSGIEKNIVKMTHYGFKNNLLIAVKEYFSYYQIKYHEIPLVMEFSNPLFLQIYCKTLHKEKSTGPYRGHKGMKDIIEKFFYKVDKDVLSNKLGYPNSKKPSWELAKLIAQEMAEKAQDYLLITEVLVHESATMEKHNINPGLLLGMIEEGLLIKDGHYKANEEVIRFSYQKFSDHLIVRYFLNKYLIKDQSGNHQLNLQSDEIKRAFDNPYMFGGILSAMSCQVPERTKGKDLIEFASPSRRKFYYDSYIDSLIWRDPKTITDVSKVLNILNEIIQHRFDYNDEILKTLISLSTVPSHPLNGDFLNSILEKKNMKRRDNLWTKFINGEFSEDNSTTQLVVNWGWADMDKDHIPLDSIRLLSFVLAWFFTSSNRFLRDKATKSLTRVLTEDLLISIDLIKYFSKIDDPYIIERVLISTYGAAIRSSNPSELKKIARCVFQQFFSDKPPLNFVIQYYARSILKLCKSKKIALGFVRWKKCENSFGYKLPKLPSINQLERKIGGFPKDDQFNKKWGLIAIQSSALGFGDFSRYVLQGDRKILPWIDENIKTTKDLEKVFYRNLPRKTKPLYRLYSKSAGSYNFLKSVKSWGEEEFKKEDTARWIAAMDLLRNKIVKSLSSSDQKKFKKSIDPYLQSGPHHNEEKHIKSEWLQRYVLWRTLQMYDVDLLGSYDRILDYRHSGGRGPDKIERIGKKYQWIAYFEAAALFFDNYQYKAIYSSDPDDFFHISQLTYMDHIDPTILIRSKKDRPNFEKLYGLSFRDCVLPVKGSELAWLKNQTDIFELQDLINIKDRNVEEWLMLEGHYNFEEVTPPEVDRYDEKYKRIFYVINSYLFKLEEIEKVKLFLRSTNFIGRWMPESNDMTNPHLGEFGWSEYYRKQVSSGEWLRDSRIPFDYKMTSEGYLYESGTYDCSMDETISFSLPSNAILNGMNLSFGKVDGQFVDGSGNIVACDLSNHPSGIMILKEKFNQFLLENNLGVFWTVISEKDFIGGRIGREDWLGRLEYSQGLIFANNSFEKFDPIVKFNDPKSLS